MENPLWSYCESVDAKYGVLAMQSSALPLSWTGTTAGRRSQIDARICLDVKLDALQYCIDKDDDPLI